MKYEVRKRNTAVATLIKNYSNKHSGKVSESRKEIQVRFDHLDWKDQKKIILAFLDSCKSDRQWIYRKLYENWDKSFESKVREIWESYREPMCAWSVIRFFPPDYVLDNIESFSGDRDYYFICLRFADDPSFVIDESKLRPVDYLSVLFHSGRKISDDKALDIIYGIIHNLCSYLPSGIILDRIEDRGQNNDIITPSNFRSIRLARYYLFESNAEAVSSFDHWNQRLYDKISESPEYLSVLASNRNDYSVREQMVAIVKRYAYEALDDKYKSSPDFEPSDEACGLLPDCKTSDDLNDRQPDDELYGNFPEQLIDAIEENSFEFADDIFNLPTVKSEDVSSYPSVNKQDVLESFEKSNPDFKGLYEDFELDENIIEKSQSDEMGTH